MGNYEEVTEVGFYALLDRQVLEVVKKPHNEENSVIYISNNEIIGLERYHFSATGCILKTYYQYIGD